MQKSGTRKRFRVAVAAALPHTCPMMETAENLARDERRHSDYERVRQAIEYVSQNWKAQPPVEDIAGHIGLSPSQFTAVFRRWAGLSPKQFLQAVTIDHARRILRDSASVLDTAYETGLSGPGRLHDLFVSHEALSPGEYKSGGEGLVLTYGYHLSPFGDAIAVSSPRGLAGLGWVDDKPRPGKAGDTGKPAGGRDGALADMKRRWPKAQFVQDDHTAATYVQRAFDPHEWRADRPLRVVLIGTDFEIRVWETLLRIPVGKAATYGAVAGHIGKPKAARAVGAAVGRNPISFVVPCHRVLGASGVLTGYHWGIARKQAILGWEAGQTAQA